MGAGKSYALILEVIKTLKILIFAVGFFVRIDKTSCVQGALGRDA